MNEFINYTLTVRNTGEIIPEVNGNKSQVGSFDEKLLTDIQHSLGLILRNKYDERDEFIHLGKKLFEALIKPIKGSFDFEAWKKLEDSNNQIRLRIIFEEVKELTELGSQIINLPWEFLCYPDDNNTFLGTHPHLALSYGYQTWLNNPIEGYAIEEYSSLKVLFVHSHPSNLPEVGFSSLVTEILSQLEKEIAVTKLKNPTLQELLDALREQPHILHFLGHGKKGALALCDKENNNEVSWLRDTELSDSLRQGCVKLAVLQACEGASPSEDFGFTGTAANLVKTHIPAVVAIRYPIEQSLAWNFIKTFYQKLSQNEPVDVAVQKGRERLANNHSSRDFGGPVLWMRLKDGLLFKPQSKPTQSQLLTRPKREGLPVEPKVHPTKEELNLPPGWTLINKLFLDQKIQNISQELILRYFDIRNPNWEEALSTDIPRRDIVDELIDSLIHNPVHGNRVTVLHGPGGEGKSTALRQAICKLVKTESDFEIIWWEDPILGNLREVLNNLPKLSNTQRWLIVCDDPSAKLIKTINELFKDPLNRGDFQFLICCRGTRWFTYGEELKWTIKPTKIQIGKLKIEELKKIVQAWIDIGKLDTQNKDNAVAEFLKLNQSSEPVFIVAIYKIIYNQTVESGIKEKIENILFDIEEKSKADDVLDAYACIVAMHKEGLPFLRLDILTQAINDAPHNNLSTEITSGKYTPSQLQSDILEQLKNEIIFNEYKFIETRQQIIAEIAYSILTRPPFNKNFEDDVYLRLAASFQKLVNKEQIGKTSQDLLDQWQHQFPDHFFQDKTYDRRELAISISETLYDIGKNPQLLTKLAKLARDDDKYLKAISYFRKTSIGGRLDRKSYHEWAISERRYGEYRSEYSSFGYSIWLCAVALADQKLKELDGESTVIYLATLGLSFWFMSDKSSHVYAKALAASAILGKNIVDQVKFKKEDGRKRTKVDLEKNLSRSTKLGIQLSDRIGTEQLFELVQLGIKAAYNHLLKERNQHTVDGLPNFPNWVIKIDQLKFSNFKTIFQKYGSEKIVTYGVNDN